ncbi:23S rRNA (pseudouridine(1915)-N(3))-methyltransferase RlmH [Loktanella sp. SALINAS62]|uniref:23S rRNA (pseudouridine(1915)-N(3))-methyltransferase RlmH n=1 Tax=Loktanella sp. SALINAS62 TaxID=2706124 RepID=UPI001B8C348A|nr:23S rRNA (pseudouridine(1915)-N(3))-methyltransferase RlmH [Loktanella sp. SALINAS62]MBS1302391.1 23S rRNA (pseudouridine(1915)-N(3))-methyltransferase RlmH [Loktanella sp. SALINAS62]
MKLSICAVGRLAPRSEERALTDDYMLRFAPVGRTLGWGPLTETQVEDRKSQGMGAEAELLRRAIPKGAVIVALDERGKPVTSPDFAERLRNWGDQGRDVAFVIGGADGIDPGLRDQADMLLSFGSMVWPHKLVRVMLAEQIYRAATILTGSPYHRT